MKIALQNPKLLIGFLLNRFIASMALKCGVLLLAALMTVSAVLAQSKSVSGSVTDETTGEKMFNVSIRIKGTTTGTLTKQDGTFKLTVPGDDAILVFSSIGYESQEISVAGKTTLDIAMKTNVNSLNDVVVVGYGTVQKRNLTSAVATISSKDFLQGGYNSPMQMIEGKVAGLTVSNPAIADPNRGADIQIRGAASLNAGNGPLIVIDGMPGGDLRNVALQDIASITVLKDAAASAIYGSRGANGVVLVTTKQAKSGVVSVTYDSYFEHDVVANKPDILSAEEFIEKGRDTDQGARTNWYDELIRKDNFGQNQLLAVSGGTENSMFRISGNFRTKSGIDIASDRKEYGYRANFLQKAIKGKLILSGNISQRTAKEEYTNYDAFKQAVKLNPTLPVMDPDDPIMYNTFKGYDTYNPVQDLLTRENGADQNYSIIDLNARLNIVSNLSTEIKLGKQSHEMLKREYYSSKSAESVLNDRKGRARLQNERWNDYIMEWINRYNTRIGKHDLDLMAGYSYQESINQGFWAENMDFLSDAFGYNNLETGQWNRETGRLGMDSWKSKEKLIAFLGRLNYNFDDKYFLTASFRYEGNTKFGKDNKWGGFPSISAAWRVTSLPVFEGSKTINDLKLRLSYGETGRSGFDRYTALKRYSPYGRYINDDGEWIQVYGPGNNFNPDLHWERAVSYNVGVDFALLDRKISGSLDLYDRRSKGLLDNYDVPVGPYLHTQMFVNVGTTSAKGVELQLNWNVYDSRNFSYNTVINASYTKTRLVTWSNNEFQGNFRELESLPSPGNPGYAYRLDPNTELGSFYGYKYAGVDEDGKILIWKDGIVGKEKVVASSEANADRDRTYIGHGAPRYELGWGNRFRYKNLDLSLFFRGRFDYQILNLYQMYYGLVAEPGVNLLKDAYSRNGHITSGKVITDYFLENGDYFRLDNLTLGWNPKFKTDYIKSARIYASVRNVFTLTKFTGLDPTSIGVVGLTPGYGSLDVYPVTRTYTVGLQVTL